MNPDTPQRQALGVVSVAKQRLDDERRVAERTIRAQVADLTQRSRAEYERAVVAADRLGVPKAQIALAVGTTNPKPIRDIIARATRAREMAVHDRFSLGDGEDLLVIHLAGDELETACAATGWTASDAISAGVDRAVFRITSGTAMVAETRSFVESVGRLHPVVSFVRSRGSAEALAWWTESR